MPHLLHCVPCLGGAAVRPPARCRRLPRPGAAGRVAEHLQPSAGVSLVRDLQATNQHDSPSLTGQRLYSVTIGSVACRASNEMTTSSPYGILQHGRTVAL